MGWPVPVTRRGLLGLGAGAAVIAGCGRRAANHTSSVGTLPHAVKRKIRMAVQLGVEVTGTFIGSVEQQVIDAYLQEHWVRRHPGVELVTDAGANPDNSVAAIVAGNGPDVLVGCCVYLASLFQAGLLAPVDPWLKQDNIARTLFPNPILQTMSIGDRLLGLPGSIRTGPLYYNQTMLDELGLAYPHADWTHLEATRLWEAVVGYRRGQQVYGAFLKHEASATQFVLRGWGGAPYDATHATCLLNSPRCVAAYRDWYVPLFRTKAATYTNPTTLKSLQTGRVAFATACCTSLQAMVMGIGTSMKWDILPMPALPVGGHLNFWGSGMYGMNAASKAPAALVWDLLKFIVFDRGWQHMLARLILAPPNTTSAAAWDDWLQIVRATAPMLRSKHLEYFQTSVGGTWGRAYFRYNPVQANAIWQKYATAMFAGRMGVVQGLDQLTAQINALQRAVAAGAAAKKGG